jgi:hypothetical protein
MTWSFTREREIYNIALRHSKIFGDYNENEKKLINSKQDNKPFRQLI